MCSLQSHDRVKVHPSAFCRNGFSLIEALIASILIATAVAALAHLVAVGAAQGVTIRSHTTAIAAAQSKLDQLRSLAWTYAPDGTPLSDQSTDLSADPPRPSGGPGLSISPVRSLLEDHSGFVDYLAPTGASCDDEECGAVAYVRRWSIALFDAADSETVAIQVCVFRLNAQQADACVSAIRTRRP